MALDFLSDVTSKSLAKTLDASALRQRAISNNIANVETPGYKRSYVAFEDELRAIMNGESGHDRRQALNELEPISLTDMQSPARADGNNVNIDAEIADLAKNSLKYKATATILEARAVMLRSAIQGR
ncbi:MAG: flagellar basal body rod protein FlgB [Armatimonadetes bacterium]|nr:flagellar basal body rod protein FlgB [Armatimonadota bacterium]